MKRLLATALAAVALAPLGGGVAHANYEPGCETVGWGFNLFGSFAERRTICDGPMNADGSWTRAREIWRPARNVPLRTSCGSYGCTSSGGYFDPGGTIAFEKYLVFPTNVLPDEPGWLPPGHLVIR